MASPTSRRADPTTRFAGSIRRADWGTRRYVSWRRGAEGKIRDAKTEPATIPTQPPVVRRPVTGESLRCWWTSRASV